MHAIHELRGPGCFDNRKKRTRNMGDISRYTTNETVVGLVDVNAIIGQMWQVSQFRRTPSILVWRFTIISQFPAFVRAPDSLRCCLIYSCKGDGFKPLFPAYSKIIRIIKYLIQIICNWWIEELVRIYIKDEDLYFADNTQDKRKGQTD